MAVLGSLIVLPQTSRAQEPWYRSYEKGVAAIEASDWEEAVRLLSASIEHGPQAGRSVRTYGVRFVDFLPGYYLAIAQYNRGNYEDAAERMSAVLEKRLIKEGDDEYSAARELLERAELALRAQRGRQAAGSSDAPTESENAEGVDLPGSRGARAVARSTAPAYARGRYVALAIGNEAYQHFPALQTPIEDAQAVLAVLEKSYGFETRFVENASRADILDTVDETMSALSEDDSLLIFYAGHGVLDEESNEGYWLPVTAQPDRRSEWLSNSEIRNILRRSPAKHVLVIADSCFSGTLTRAVRIGRAFETDLDRYFEKLASQKSRTALTSGGLEPVDDGGGGGHSIFAGSLLRALESNDKPILEAEVLHTEITRDVVLNSTGGQQPLYSDVRNTGHENGDFLFIRTMPPER
ncbi:MAG TPA: caspase family protein [Vicinamibacteria bacterium]|nr:caspase family protein [Vicinamibacteria bacterium]